MPTENELFSAVDALLEQVSHDDLPPPAERRRLREAAGLTQAQIATALETRRETVANWELGKTEPRPPQRAAYARLLEKLAERFPSTSPEPDMPQTFAGQPTAPEAQPSPTGQIREPAAAPTPQEPPSGSSVIPAPAT
ncbi:helix-turn-helix transcriptional regulator, partial [Streptomyces sp. NPDC049099]|uniref:helix-turn-helix transcriptional regulator n=1 Tax=Streptomyces sp. NPDC049099 TaxID=3155768 RepID=UPI00341E41D4